MVKRVTQPIEVDKGQYSSGDPSLMPDGYSLRIRNYLLRPGRLESRSPFVYDALASIRALGLFDDTVNKAWRMLAMDFLLHPYEKAASGETWSGSLGTLVGSRLSDAANYRGNFYGMMDDGTGVPLAAFSFNGTAFSNSPFNSAIQSRCVTAYLDRLFLAYPRVTVAPVHNAAACYDPGWSGANCVIRAITVGSTVARRVFLDSTSGVCSIAAGALAVAGNAADLPFIWRQDLRNNDTVNRLPLTFRCNLSFASPYDEVTAAGMRSLPVALGAMSVYGAGSVVVRATTAGTTAVGAPAFTSGLGDQIVDGTVTWTVVSPTTIAIPETFAPTLIDSVQGFGTYWTPFTVPNRPNAANVFMTVLFKNSSQPLLTSLNTVDVSYKDGLADGDPLKKNYGFQVTQGDFYFPFLNAEGSNTNTIDMNSIIWSDIFAPKQFRAAQTYELWESPGYPTAACVLSGRYLVFKRNTFWIFAGNQDTTSLDVIPIRKEDKKDSVGCIGPKALDTLDNTAFFIGEDGVYSYSPLAGIANYQVKGGLEEIGGDAMREEIMNRGANWVESQASNFNMPILRINKRDREVWVYTQKGTIYVYNIKSQGWTTIDVNGGANGADICDMIYNPNTRKMYVAFSAGLARHDWNVAPANDTIDNSNNYAPTRTLIPKPIELFADRMDATVDNVGVFITGTTASQSGATLTAYASFDRGATFPWSDPVTVDLTIPRNQIDLYENGPSLTIKLDYVGKAGASTISISKLDAVLYVFGGEYPQVRPALAGTPVQ